MEVVTAGAQDELMQSLDYKLKTSNTSCVMVRHDAVNAAANRALAPKALKLPKLETQVIHIDLGKTQNGCCQTAPQNSPQSMRVWPGLRLIGAGGKIPKGVFVAGRKWSRTE